MEGESQKLDTWGVLELFGHLKLAGRISEQSVGGDSLIRIDVPEVNRNGTALHPYTRYFGAKAVYSLSPTSEQIARAVAAAIQAEPVKPYEMRLPNPALPAPSDDEEWLER